MVYHLVLYEDWPLKPRVLWFNVLTWLNRKVRYLKWSSWERSRISTPSRLSKNMLNPEVYPCQKPKQRSLSNECIGYNSLVPEYILHWRGLNVILLLPPITDNFLYLRYKNIWEMMSRLDFHFGKHVSAYFWINDRGRIFKVARFEDIVIGCLGCCNR